MGLSPSCCVNSNELKHQKSDPYLNNVQLKHSNTGLIIIEEILELILSINKRIPELEALFIILNNIYDLETQAKSIENSKKIIFSELRDLIFSDPSNINKKIDLIKSSLTKLEFYYPDLLLNLQKNLENLSNLSKNQINNNVECSMLTSANLWYNSFGNKTIIKWSEFELFLKELMNNSGYHLSESQITFIKYNLDINNDYKIDILSWNNFYNKYWVIKSKRISIPKYIIDFDYAQKLELIYNPPKYSKQCLYPIGSVFSIDKTGCTSILTNKIEKNLLKEPIIFGKTSKSNEKKIAFSNEDDISKEQFQIFAKIESETSIGYYLNSLSIRNLTCFVVEEKGYALYKNNIINVNGNYFKINYVYPVPHLYQDDTYFYIEPRKGRYITENNQENKITDEENQKLNSIMENEVPFIEIEFFKNGPNQKKFCFKVLNPLEEYNIRIGSSLKSEILIPDEKQKYVLKNHCVLEYIPNKFWIIKDIPIINKLEEFQKTFLLSCSYQEYIDKKLGKEIIFKGNKLINGQKIYTNGHLFQVREK